MRMIRIAAAAALLAGIGVAAPAEAHVDACAGTGVLNTPPLLYPVPPTAAPRNGPIAGALGLCTNLIPAGVVGHIEGYCGRSQGLATFADHHTALFVTAGSTVVVGPGSAVGVADAVPAVGQSCLSGATQFQVTGLLVLA